MIRDDLFLRLKKIFSTEVIVKNISRKDLPRQDLDLRQRFNKLRMQGGHRLCSEKENKIRNETFRYHRISIGD